MADADEQNRLAAKWTCSYRLRPYYRNVGIFVTAFFGFMGVLATVTTYFNVDGSFERPKLSALVFAVVFSSFFFLGVLILIQYYNYRFFANDSSFRQNGIFRDDHVSFDRVDELTWCRFPKGGKVRLRGPFGEATIEFANFEDSQRECLISMLRHGVDDAKQRGWSKFHRQLDDSRTKRGFSPRTWLLFGMFFAVSSISFLVSWILGFGPVHHLMAIVNAAATVYVLRELRSRNAVFDRLSRQRVRGEPDQE